LSHIGAWAPMAEQKAVAGYLTQTENIQQYLTHYKKELEKRLQHIHEGFISLKNKGYKVDAVAPQAAIYLTIKIDLAGQTLGGQKLNNQSDVTSYILSEAKLAVVPFYAFGADKDSPWYRLSVGTSKIEDIDEMFRKLEDSLREG